MKARKILAKALSSPAIFDLAKWKFWCSSLVQAFESSGSHHIYGRAGLIEQVNLQDVDGKAKPYQVRQFLKLIERYNLLIDES